MERLFQRKRDRKSLILMDLYYCDHNKDYLQNSVVERFGAHSIAYSVRPQLINFFSNSYVVSSIYTTQRLNIFEETFISWWEFVLRMTFCTVLPSLRPLAWISLNPKEINLYFWVNLRGEQCTFAHCFCSILGATLTNSCGGVTFLRPFFSPLLLPFSGAAK